MKIHKKANNPYYLCVCKYCEKYGNEVVELEGRISTMENHLKNCQHYNTHRTVEASVSSAVSAAITTYTARKREESYVRSTKIRKITNFMDRQMTDNEVKTMRKRLIEMIADAALPFAWIERPSTIRFFNSIRPSAIQALPTRRVLSGALLRNHARSSRDAFLPEMRRHIDLGCTVCFVCYGWLDAGKCHILGCVVSVGGLWFSFDEALGEGNVILSDRHDGVATAKQIEAAVYKTEKEFGFQIGCVTTDEAGQCHRAKKILGLRFPNRYFGKCYAHQVSLIRKPTLSLTSTLQAQINSTYAWNSAAKSYMESFYVFCA
jgi:hypothetical protein